MNGGYVLVPINDYHTTTGTPNVYTLNSVSQSHGDHLDDAIESLEGESWTPLAETMFSVYTYFMSRNTSRPSGRPGRLHEVPEVHLPAARDGHGRRPQHHRRPTVPDSPVQWHCQKNFVMLITDGEPTKDDFDTLVADHHSPGLRRLRRT